MLHPDHAEILVERQLAATDWIEAAPLPDCDLGKLLAYRRALKEIRARKSWEELLELEVPKFGKG